MKANWSSWFQSVWSLNLQFIQSFSNWQVKMVQVKCREVGKQGEQNERIWKVQYLSLWQGEPFWPASQWWGFQDITFFQVQPLDQWVKQWQYLISVFYFFSRFIYQGPTISITYMHRGKQMVLKITWQQDLWQWDLWFVLGFLVMWDFRRAAKILLIWLQDYWMRSRRTRFSSPHLPTPFPHRFSLVTQLECCRFFWERPVSFYQHWLELKSLQSIPSTADKYQGSKSGCARVCFLKLIFFL